MGELVLECLRDLAVLDVIWGFCDITIKELPSNLVNCYTKQKVKVMSDNKQAHKSVLLFTFFSKHLIQHFYSEKKYKYVSNTGRKFLSQTIFKSKTFQHDKKHFKNKIEYIFPSNQRNITVLG